MSEQQTNRSGADEGVGGGVVTDAACDDAFHQPTPLTSTVLVIEAEKERLQRKPPTASAEACTGPTGCLSPMASLSDAPSPCGCAGTNQPLGRGYNTAFNKVAERPRLGEEIRPERAR